MSLWLYEYRGSRRTVTIHAGSCGFCKEGKGRSGRGTKPANGRWLGPFEGLDEARKAAMALPPAAVSEDRCCRKTARPRRG
jgi:hypothetical protein